MTSESCPDCNPAKVHGKDPLCDKHWHEYLGTHNGGRGENPVLECATCKDADTGLPLAFNGYLFKGDDCPQCHSKLIRVS